MSSKIEDLDPDVQLMAQRLIAECAKEGVILIVTHTYRSYEEQAMLYAQGREAPGKVVTWAPPGYSWHNFRRAFDVAIKSWIGDSTRNDLYDGPWEFIGNMGEKCGLEWGGRWKKPDRPHFQHTGGFTLAHLRAKRDAGGFA